MVQATTESYRLYAYNPNQMFLPNHEETFGSQYLKIDSPAKSDTLTAVRTKSYYQEYKISRTNWMSLDHEESRCNSQQSKENTTKCITEYLESKIGCSMGLQLSFTGLKRLTWALLWMYEPLTIFLFRCNTTKEFEAYAILSHKISDGNETEIFKLTGCLSSCNKYEYTVQPLTNLRTFKSDIYGNSYKIKFVIPSGRHVEKTQVRILRFSKFRIGILYILILAVHNLRLELLAG